MTPRSLLITLAVLALALPGRVSASALDSLPDGFSTVTQVSGLTDPTAVAYTPDGRMLVAEKAGTVRIVSAQRGAVPRGSYIVSTRALDVRGRVLAAVTSSIHPRMH